MLVAELALSDEPRDNGKQERPVHPPVSEAMTSYLKELEEWEELLESQLAVALVEYMEAQRGAEMRS